MKTDNLYRYKGGYDSDGSGEECLYCLVIEESDYRGTDGTWEPGVVYIGRDGRIRSTTAARWAERFAPVAEYTGDDEQTLAMIRRTAPPVESEFDIGDVIGAWHESNVSQTAELLQMMAATVGAVGRFSDEHLPNLGLKWDEENGKTTGLREVSFTILPRHLAYVSSHYIVEAAEVDGGYRFTISK